MKFKKEQKVEFCENGKAGTVVDVIVKTSEENGKKRCKVLYLVKPDDATDFDEYMVCSKKELRHLRPTSSEEDKFIYNEITTEDGFKILMVAECINGPIIFTSDTRPNSASYTYSAYISQIKKELRVAYAICSKDDSYDFGIGLKIARHRLKEHPYFRIYAEREHVFDNETVNAILIAKGNYIAKNIERFVNKRGEHFKF